MSKSLPPTEPTRDDLHVLLERGWIPAFVLLFSPEDGTEARVFSRIPERLQVTSGGLGFRFGVALSGLLGSVPEEVQEGFLHGFLEAVQRSHMAQALLRAVDRWLQAEDQTPSPSSVPAPSKIPEA